MDNDKLLAQLRGWYEGAVTSDTYAAWRGEPVQMGLDEIISDLQRMLDERGASLA